jgi:predicted DsbA family dithiol-disulfide isomerase
MRNEYGAEVIWAPFDLHPEYPPEGVPRPPSTGEMEARFAESGLVYDPPPVRANSLKALRLAEHARAEGVFDTMHARLMDAYWAEAQNIGDPAVLRALAGEVGLEGADEILETDAYLDVVHASTAQAVAAGVTGVPAFVLDRRMLVLGAHPRTTFERAFAQLDSERSA